MGENLLVTQPRPKGTFNTCTRAWKRHVAILMKARGMTKVELGAIVDATPQALSGLLLSDKDSSSKLKTKIEKALGWDGRLDSSDDDPLKQHFLAIWEDLSEAERAFIETSVKIRARKH